MSIFALVAQNNAVTPPGLKWLTNGAVAIVLIVCVVLIVYKIISRREKK